MSENQPPCCADLEDPPCEQHRQAARVVRQGPRLRHGGGQRVIGDSGRARSIAVPDELPEPRPRPGA